MERNDKNKQFAGIYQTNAVQIRQKSLRKRFLSCRLKTIYTGLPNWSLPQHTFSQDHCSSSVPFICHIKDPYLTLTSHSKGHNTQVPVVDVCTENVNTEVTTENKLRTLSESVLTMENAMESNLDLCMTKKQKISFQPPETTRMGQCSSNTQKELENDNVKAKVVGGFNKLDIVRQSIHECEKEIRQLEKYYLTYTILESKQKSVAVAEEEIKKFEFENLEFLEYLEDIPDSYNILENSTDDIFGMREE